MHFGVHSPVGGQPDGLTSTSRPSTLTGGMHDEGAHPGPDVQGDALGGTVVTVAVHGRFP